MKRQIAAPMIAVGIAALLLVAGAGPAQASNKRLSQNYSYTMGDDIASRVGGLFNVVAGLEASTLVYYDRKAQNIVTYIVGSADEVAGAKREIEAFVSAVTEYLVPFAKTQYGIDMSEKDITLIYYNDGGDSSPFEVVRRENGQYKVPPAPQGDDRE